MIIQSITDILNFRYCPGKYLKRWDQIYPGDPSYIQTTLTEFPKIFNHFKLVIHKDGYYVNKNNLSDDVFCVNNIEMIKTLPNIIEKSKLNTFNNLICCGEDANLGGSGILSVLNEIKHQFKKIYYEAKNVECDFVQTIPMGMNVAYMLRNDSQSVLKYINGHNNKTKLIGSAFGSKWPQLNNKPDRCALREFTQQSHFMDDMFCDPLDYYKQLSQYKFFAAPLGAGIQTPKICESIMCNTIPVVTDHITHRELCNYYDLPLLIVNKWSDLTEDFLNEQWENKYSKINWEEQKEKFLVTNFNQLLN